MILALGLFSYFLLYHEIKHVQKNKKIRNNYLSFWCGMVYKVIQNI
jgi:hypothetical protein